MTGSDKVFTAIGISFAVIAGIAALGIITALPVKWCWNAAMVPVFGLPAITWGKAWCLQFLAACLIKSVHTSTK